MKCSFIQNFLRAFQVFGLALALSSCSKLQSINVDRAGIDPRADHLASSQIADSFQVAEVQVVATQNNDQPSELNKSDLGVDASHVQIQKSALNKEFLLSTNMLSQTPAPMFSSLQSRVVSFIERDHKIYLLDVTKNNFLSETNIPQNLLLAEFDILQDKEEAYVIDFNQGMKQIFTAGDMFASDDPQFAGAEYKLPTARVHLSYLENVELQAEALFIQQVAQVESTNTSGIQSVPVEVRYQIKPYRPAQDFVPFKSPGFDKLGYFEANPLLLADGSTRLYAMKWNEKKNIQFAISANTPLKYRDLVKSAVLYWNKVLGEGKITVTQLEDKTVTAPHFDHNIIQWADWDAAGYAFADAHVDPRSGEVTSAQVFFPSAFIEANVPKRIRLIEGAQDVVGHAHFQVGLRGFSTARFCERNLYKDLKTLLSTEGISEAAMDKAMRDYVYEVIAHEVGHVLGLRHNFAGNLASNYDFSERKKLIMSYYQNQKAPENIISSSSVMEYSRFEESSWNGDILQRPDSKALSYDDMAISHLYLNKEIPEQRPAFCTDSQVSIYADCNMSDAGRSIVSSATGMYQFNLDSLAARLLNLYIVKTKAPDDRGADLISVAAVDLNAKSLAKTLTIDLAKFVSTLKANTKLIAVRYSRNQQVHQDQAILEQMEKEYLTNEVQRLGGLSELLKALPSDFDTQLINKFNQLVELPLFNTGTTASGVAYAFSEDEKKTMKAQVALLSTQLKEEMILNEIKILSGEDFSFEATYGQSKPEESVNWADFKLTEDLADLLLKRIDLYAFSKQITKFGADVLKKDGSHLQVELPYYVYPQNIRLAAASLLNNGHDSVEWAYIQKIKASDLMDKELLLMGDEDQIDKTSLNKETLKWLLNNKKIQSVLVN